MISNSLRTAVLATTFLVGGAASGAILLIDGNSAGQDWNTAPDWSNNQAVTTNEDYDTNGFGLRTPNTPTWASTFPSGSTLTIQDTETNTSGAMIIKAGTLNMGTVYLGLGGSVSANANNGSNLATTWNLDVLEVLATSVEGNSARIFGSYTGNNMTFNFAELTGSGYLSLGTNANTEYNVNITDASGFGGVLDLVAGNVTLDSALSMGGASFVMGSGGSTFDFGSYDLTVGSFDFGGTSLAASTYTSSDLNTLLSTSAFSGAGSLTVVPEPSAVAVLMGCSVLAIALLRRSSTRA